MRLGLAASAVALLLGLLTWLLLLSTKTDAPSYERTLRALDEFALAEASLYRDVLRARAGLLRDYDPLIRACVEMDSAIAQFRLHAHEQRLEMATIDRLAEMVEAQEALTEQFKTANALAQNSLSYFGYVIATPAVSAQDFRLAMETAALATSVFRLTLDTSPESTAAVQQKLEQLASRIPDAGPDTNTAKALVTHARLLQQVLPAVDRTVKGLLAVPNDQALGAIRLLFAERHARVEATAHRFRLLLYATSLLLLLALIELGRRLRVRALALRQQAAFEHVIAASSTRLINCPPAEVDALLKLVLGELGRAIGVERAYIALNQQPTGIQTWCAEGATVPAGWSHRALKLAARLATAEHQIVMVTNVDALPPGEWRDALLEAGVRSFACVPLFRPGRVSGIMAFEALRHRRDRTFPASDLMRLAGDAVTNAIERDFLERDRAKLTKRLERARRMEAVGSLASGIAHNFNNIIGAITGYAEMAEAKIPPCTAPVRHIHEIRRATERGRDLVDGILAFGRRRDTRARVVPARTCLEEAASLLRASLPPGIELAMPDITAPVVMFGDPAQLQQVILNLCTNASQAMGGLGRIDVTAEQEHLTAALQLSHGKLAPGRYVRIAVGDTGHGFDEEVARHLFEPFFTTRSMGTGLGLATVREIVADHEGAINVRSTPGLGSRFEAWFPEVAAGDADREAPSLPLGHGEAVLIIEADRERRLGDEEVLAALGYEPLGFDHPADAVAACRADPARFDAIVIGLSGSVESGLRLARTLHDAVTGQPILVVVDSAHDADIHALAEEAGVVEILSRPLVGSELAAALRRCVPSPSGFSRNETPKN
jgi:signal transduction histidine kinase